MHTPAAAVSPPCWPAPALRIAADQPVIGLITKTETNPFFVKMKEGAHGRRQGQAAPSCCPAPARPTATTPAR